MSGTSLDGSTPVNADGRRRRGEDNRARIITALVALVREGDFTPGAEQVAMRADVSLRTVFRHFEDMDRLYAQIVDPMEAELMKITQRPFMSNDWRGKVVELVDRRTAAYEEIAPLRRAADLHRYKSPTLAAAAERFARVLRTILDGLAPELVGTPLIEAIDALLSFETWERLRTVQGLSASQAREVLETSIRKLSDEG